MPTPGLQTGSPFSGFLENAVVSTIVTSANVTSSTAGLVVAVVSIQEGSGAKTVSSFTGAGSNWGTFSLIKRSNARQLGLNDIEFWSCATTGALNGTLTANLSGTLSGNDAVALWVYCFDANAQTTVGISNTNSGGTASASVALTGTTNGSVVIGGFANWTNSNVPGSWACTNDGTVTSWTHSFTVAGDSQGNGLSGAITGNPTLSATITGSTDWDGVAVEVKAVVTINQPYFIGPEIQQRPIWNPERSHISYPVGPASQVVIVPTDPVPPVAPEKFLRIAWNPERTESQWVGPPSQVVVVPKAPPESIEPERFVRSAWNPEKSHISWPAGPMSQVVIVPTDPVPPVLPDKFIRAIWNPERSESVWVGPPSQVVIVPATPVQPMLPESFIRTIWNPERSHVSAPGVPISPVVAPTIGFFFGPDNYLRWPWNPEKSYLACPVGPSNLFVIVPVDPVPPLQPERFARPPWDPRSTIDVATAPTQPAAPPPTLVSQVSPERLILANYWWSPDRNLIILDPLPRENFVQSPQPNECNRYGQKIALKVETKDLDDKGTGPAYDYSKLPKP